jgi:hypothetical protein
MNLGNIRWYSTSINNNTKYKNRQQLF